MKDYWISVRHDEKLALEKLYKLVKSEHFTDQYEVKNDSMGREKYDIYKSGIKICSLERALGTSGYIYALELPKLESKECVYFNKCDKSAYSVFTKLQEIYDELSIKNVKLTRVAPKAERFSNAVKEITRRQDVVRKLRAGRVIEI